MDLEAAGAVARDAHASGALMLMLNASLNVNASTSACAAKIVG